LALRVEGNMWNAYYALPDSMEGAVWLGSIAMRFVTNDGQLAVKRLERKAQFINMMREAVADIIEEECGARPTWPKGPVRAPEHERSKNG
jgi:hypothetical protein